MNREILLANLKDAEAYVIAAKEAITDWDNKPSNNCFDSLKHAAEVIQAQLHAERQNTDRYFSSIHTRKFTVANIKFIAELICEVDLDGYSDDIFTIELDQ